MRSHTIGIHFHRNKPKVDIRKFDTFYTIDILSQDSSDGSTVFLYFQTLQQIIEFKNAIISEFDKLMREYKEVDLG